MFEIKNTKMKHLIILSLLFIACGTTNSGTSQYSSSSTEQIFVADQNKGSGGKCYSKMARGNDRLWTQVICQKDITKGLIAQIQADLVRLGYEVDSMEVSKSKFGSTTKKAIKAFQIKNNMAYGGIDWATVNRLKNQLI